MSSQKYAAVFDQGMFKDNPQACLELSVGDTQLGKKIQFPMVLTQHDWSSSVGVSPAISAQAAQTGYTSLWHIDYEGTTSSLYVASGVKYIFLLPSTDENIKAVQDNTLNDLVDDLVELGRRGVWYERCIEGEAIIIPGGWPHAVYTSIDSIVYSTNYLHNFNIPNQLIIWQRFASSLDDNSTTDNLRELYTIVTSGLASLEKLLERLDNGDSTANNLPSSDHIELLLAFYTDLVNRPRWTRLTLKNGTKKRILDIVKLIRFRLNQR